jgi:hypothetical protein
MYRERCHATVPLQNAWLERAGKQQQMLSQKALLPGSCGCSSCAVCRSVFSTHLCYDCLCIFLLEEEESQLRVVLHAQAANSTTSSQNAEHATQAA